MIKIDIISGFLGAGKTTLIKKFLKDGFKNEKVVLIENEFGEIGIDGSMLRDYDIEIKEMNSGCICCTISGDFKLALTEILQLYTPDRIIIEPSGVGKLSDVINGCNKFIKDNINLNILICVIDAQKYQMYKKNFAEFYINQVKHSKTIILSRTQFMSTHELDIILEDIRNYNPKAAVVMTDWSLINGEKLIRTAEEQEEEWDKSMLQAPTPFRKLSRKNTNHPQARHHADDVFQVWSKETTTIFKRSNIEEILHKLDHLKGNILRAKGIIPVENNLWIQFNYVPGEIEIIETQPDYIGRICVIGEQVQDAILTDMFDLSTHKA